MVDNMNPAPVPPVEPAPVESKGGFFSSTLGKVLLVVGALSLVAGLLAVIGLFVLGNGLFNAVKDEVIKTSTAATSQASSPGGTESEPPAEPRDAAPLEDVFTFRSPFVPTVKPPAVKSEASDSDSDSDSGSSDSSGTASTVPADTLALQSIKTQDGELVATFIWNGKTYTAGEGDTLEGTPWKVVNLTSSSATMLYGDSEVTLSVGQGITK